MRKLTLTKTLYSPSISHTHTLKCKDEESTCIGKFDTPLSSTERSKMCQGGPFRNRVPHARIHSILYSKLRYIHKIFRLIVNYKGRAAVNSMYYISPQFFKGGAQKGEIPKVRSRSTSAKPHVEMARE